MAISDQYLLQRSPAFQLEPRQEAAVDIALKKAPVPPCTLLRGHVQGKCGPIVGATVKIFSNQYQPIAHAVTDLQGKFIFENILPPGNYIAVAAAEGYKVSPEHRFIIVPKLQAYLALELETSKYIKLGTVYGNVYNHTNDNLGNAKILISDYNTPSCIEAVTQSNDDGEFLVYGLRPDKYWISAQKEGYVPLPEKISFEIFPNEISSVNLFLYPCQNASGGTISGKISHNGKAVPNAVAALYKVETNGHYMVALSEANENGIYLFPDVKAGEYLVKSKQETETGVSRTE